MPWRPSRRGLVQAPDEARPRLLIVGSGRGRDFVPTPKSSESGRGRVQLRPVRRCRPLRPGLVHGARQPCDRIRGLLARRPAALSGRSSSASSSPRRSRLACRSSPRGPARSPGAGDSAPTSFPATGWSLPACSPPGAQPSSRDARRAPARRVRLYSTEAMAERLASATTASLRSADERRTELPTPLSGSVRRPRTAPARAAAARFARSHSAAEPEARAEPAPTREHLEPPGARLAAAVANPYGQPRAWTVWVTETIRGGVKPAAYRMPPRRCLLNVGSTYDSSVWPPPVNHARPPWKECATRSDGRRPSPHLRARSSPRRASRAPQRTAADCA